MSDHFPEDLDTQPEDTGFSTEAETISGRDLGGYRVISHLLSGATGELWLAMSKEKKSEQIFLAKTLHARMGMDQKFMDRFWMHAQQASGLLHPHIAQFITGGEANNVPFLIFEYVPGVSLASVMERTPLLPVWFVLKAAVQICGALHYAHHTEAFQNVRPPIVHQNLSPKKVMFASDGQVKLLGFGFSQLAMEIQDIPSKVRIERFAHIAPEQIRGTFQGPQSDIYGVGVLLYRMLTGTVPFSSNSVFHLIQRISEGNPKPPSQINPDIPPALERIVLRALHHRLEERYDSANVLHEDLLSIQATLSPRVVALELSHYLRDLFPNVHWTEGTAASASSKSAPDQDSTVQEDWEVVTMTPGFPLMEKPIAEDQTEEGLAASLDEKDKI
jgi:eukaryotic-like serine/threonine-protein kinase